MECSARTVEKLTRGYAYQSRWHPGTRRWELAQQLGLWLTLLAGSSSIVIQNIEQTSGLTRLVRRRGGESLDWVNHDCGCGKYFGFGKYSEECGESMREEESEK